MVVLTGCESLLDVPESHENFCAQLQSPFYLPLVLVFPFQLVL